MDFYTSDERCLKMTHRSQAEGCLWQQCRIQVSSDNGIVHRAHDGINKVIGIAQFHGVSKEFVQLIRSNDIRDGNVLENEIDAILQQISGGDTAVTFNNYRPVCNTMMTDISKLGLMPLF
ncbi:hypothetical protein E2C01_028394 [Portunus trituberculatus]|uniref:Uncharacterized protein n=1 Tax=Portunus trituberculatus TaxID=210409 RepID=A0A5B7EP09_PORTR|nr:hypothetical protein [Portunus trituberculatus]